MDPSTATPKSSEATPTLVRGLSLLDSVLLLAGGDGAATAAAHATDAMTAIVRKLMAEVYANSALARISAVLCATRAAALH